MTHRCNNETIKISLFGRNINDIPFFDLLPWEFSQTLNVTSKHKSILMCFSIDFAFFIRMKIISQFASFSRIKQRQTLRHIK